MTSFDDYYKLLLSVLSKTVNNVGGICCHRLEDDPSAMKGDIETHRLAARARCQLHLFFFLMDNLPM